MTRGPIYVAGAARSGTTLMSSLLASHPAVCVPALGTNMWTFFADQHGDLRDRNNLERCLDALLRYKNVAALEPDRERIVLNFEGTDHSYAALFRLILDDYTERQGRHRWADKTSYVERYVDRIFDAYPDARAIHMIRDPRDRYASAVTRWPGSKGKVGAAVARWRYSTHFAHRHSARYPGRYLVVQYETLVHDPEQTMRRVCGFLDEPYDQAMIEGAAGWRAKGSNSSFDVSADRPVFTSSVGRFASVLSDAETRFIEHHLGGAMRDYGYAASGRRMARGESLRYWLGVWPPNAARLMAWRTLEAIQHNAPSIFGRTPMKNRLMTGGG